MSENLREVRDTINEIINMHQLSLELLEQLDLTCGWLIDNDIQMPNREKFDLLLQKARNLLDEVCSSPSIFRDQKITGDGFSHGHAKRRGDDKFTEPSRT
jgi:hypothetical protein